MTIYHGSSVTVEEPQLKKGKPYNDYGQGFYCTKDLELAKEWACATNDGGVVNEYELDISGLTVANLSDEKYNILNWLALLLKNRKFVTSAPLAQEAKDYIINTFSVDLSGADVIIGYRADDSYFSFARDFVNNLISLKQLASAMFFGKLGEQIVLMSDNAFDSIRFMKGLAVDGKVYYPKRALRDREARDEYKNVGRTAKSVSHNDLFVLDILRGGIQSDDVRIQRIIPQ